MKIKIELINLELLKNYAKGDDFTLLDAGCGQEQI